ncbi:MAG: hypothetical protein HPY59_11115 [Anaerolineae bacterium]|nr:hypothetical protein [Anaerolineae bacterium]
MTLASIGFGLVVATLIGALFHLWKGGGLKDLLLYLILSWIGFWVGQAWGANLGWKFGKYGQLYLLFATVGSVFFLFVGYWLSLSNRKAKK